MDTEYVQIQCVLADGADRFGVGAVAFDQHEELLWMGNHGGHVTSYYGGTMQKYTSFQVHSNQDVRQLSTIDEGILALTAGSLRCQMRRGLSLFTHHSTNMSDMQCMLQLSPERLLIAGHQAKLIDFNLAHWKETGDIDVGDNGCVMLRSHNRLICAGNPLGRIDLRDPKTLKVEHRLDTHNGSLSDFDVQGNLLVTCGFSNRQGNLSVDRFLMVYDLRMMRAVSPIPVVVDPLYLRFMPFVSSRLALVSALGQIQLVDTVALSEPRMCLYQIDNPGAMCLGFDISTSCQAMVFGDSLGSIHLFACSNEPIFNSYSRLTEHPDPLESFSGFGIDDITPYAAIPIPILNSDMPLASDWPQQFVQNIYRRTPNIDAEILQTMKIQGPIGYAPNPKTNRRNQVLYPKESYGSKLQVKLFSSEKHSSKNPNDEVNFIAIPKRYRRVDLKYSKSGCDDYSYEQFNKTGLPGLESTLPNSYCNAMLQVLYYHEAVKTSLLSHLCSKEFCLSCELSFLFHMLSISNGTPCVPANFLRAFRTVPEASALGLILNDLHPETKLKIDFGALIQSWNRFILHQMHCELLETKKKKSEEIMIKKETMPFVYKETDFPTILEHDLSFKIRKHSTDNNVIEENTNETDISQLFGMKQLQMNTCLKCTHEVCKESILLACNLTYPLESDVQDLTFCELLRSSLCPQQTTPAWCDVCDKFNPTSQVRMLGSLPKILTINTGLHNPQYRKFWQFQMDSTVAKAVNSDLARSSTPTQSGGIKQCRYGMNCVRLGCKFKHELNPTAQPTSNNLYCNNTWLPHNIEMMLDKNKKLNVQHWETAANSADTKDAEIVENQKYSLTAVVCYIHDQNSTERKNIVALVKIPQNDPTKTDSQWYIFNDISISPVTAQEAVWFSLDWKIPCVLYYTSNDVGNYVQEITKSITQDVFVEDKCLARTGVTSSITFTPLSATEMPQPGQLIAMDAEFVTLNQEEAELRSDGKMSTVKPSHMSVARITCIRGQGPLEGVPFIDDYISTQEQVVDYLTKFSGIKPGDLDANFSSKHLTTLKSTYQKLRFLQDSGVIFIGHGLKNDFRVINLIVPSSQVIDTVFLFHLPHHRMVSLRFLAWHFLGLKIQSETHDSVEDARTALQLYRKYKELETKNSITSALKELYNVGKVLNWHVPD